MMNPQTSAPWTANFAADSPVRAAFAALDRTAQRMLEAMLFEGHSCTRIAWSIGGSVAEVRRRAGAAMLELHAALNVSDGDRGGAVAAMLVLRALDTLDPDEAELVDVMLAHQPALQRSYDEYRDLVGELCMIVPVARITPSPSVWARLCAAIDDSAAN